MEVFKSLDTDKNGVLTKEELVEGFLLARTYMSREEAEMEVDNVLKQADSNFSGKIDFSEFVLATYKRDELLSLDRVKKAFQLFDIDNDNFISKDEFMEVMGGLEANEAQWDMLLNEFDTNNDQKVDE